MRENNDKSAPLSALITHPVCLQHEMGPHHPESPSRLYAVLNALENAGLSKQMQRVDAPLATETALAAAHDPDYVASIFAAAPTHDYAYLDPDTSMNIYSLEAARRAAGAVVEGVDRVMSGTNRNAFCAVRPCGHHATYDQAMGFCIFNNVAVGARHAIDVYGLSRVAILDFDVHHGNGTENIFHDDDRVMLCSSFQHPYYPGTGADTGNAHIIPTPLAARTGSDAFRRAITASWFPALHTFKPELIIISAGFDAHRDDPLAYLDLVEDDYVWITQEILTIAALYAQGRVVSALEGGYNLTALGSSAAAHVGALIGAHS
ncbi:MAG: histone deacetylase family protein [Aeromicrobium sp.]|nr:histone deacetylase family protein [Burkholderiales bacterium]